MKTRLEKHNVCTSCFCVGISNPNCICAYSKFKTIELEFEICDCCGHLISDGQPAKTEFNDKQFETLK